PAWPASSIIILASTWTRAACRSEPRCSPVSLWTAPPAARAAGAEDQNDSGLLRKTRSMGKIGSHNRVLAGVALMCLRLLLLAVVLLVPLAGPSAQGYYPARC